jgi:hypothetical protein
MSRQGLKLTLLVFAALAAVATIVVFANWLSDTVLWPTGGAR